LNFGSVAGYRGIKEMHMTPNQYAALTLVLDDLIKDRAFKYQLPKYEICKAIRAYISHGMIDDLIVSEDKPPLESSQNMLPTDEVLERIQTVQESHIGKKV